MTKQQREDRACEAIIAGILRGFTDNDWRKVFKAMDAARCKTKKPPAPARQCCS